MCWCLLSTRIESELFSKPEGNVLDMLKTENIPDEECPICLEPLRSTQTNTCCGGYARKLKCGNHFVHVSCQINKNTDLLKCPVCRTQLASTDIYYKICSAIFINKLPLHYQRKFIDNKLINDEINDITQNYGIDYGGIKLVYDYLRGIKNDEAKITRYFKEIWAVKNN